VRIVSTVFEGATGTVVRVVPGRAKAIKREFVVNTSGEFHRFFEEQLILVNDASSGLDT
jgi:hypothetical protein